MFISAGELNIASSFPGYVANGQEVLGGLVTLNKTDEAPKAPEPQGAAIKPPALSTKDAEQALLKNIAKQADSKTGLKQRAEASLKKGPRMAQLYRRPGLGKYAALDGSALQAKRIIEEAKRNPALMKRVDPRGVLQQALKKDGPQPRQAPHFYNALRETPRVASKLTGAPTKTVSLKQLPNLVPTALRAAMTVAKMAGMTPGLPMAPLMPLMARHRPLLAPGMA